MNKLILIILFTILVSNEDIYQIEDYYRLFESVSIDVPNDYFENQGCVNGSCNNGEGTFVYGLPMYEGEWKDGKEHGNGTRTWSNGDILSGIWENGNITYGTYFYGSGRYFGDIYTGEFKNNKKGGYGIYKREDNGEIYAGEWIDDYPNGKGKKIDKDGHILEGLFFDGEIIE
tara:strand:+ start:150 stop:668 length:519 start_codon:yes stop_codon:yes gene_type:complete